jgi:FkbM family methyltransferase
MCLRRLASSAVSLVPAKETILISGAMLPPQFRTMLLFRFFSALAARCSPLPSEFVTNLGIDKRLRVHVFSADLGAAFGAPRLNIGERSSLDLALAFFQHSDCFVDVGSYIGVFVFYLRSRADGSKPIYFFEPDPSLFERIKSNLIRNKIDAIGFQAAMTTNSGKVTFYRNRTHDCSGSLVKEDWQGDALDPTEVTAMSFGDFVAEKGLGNACVKVDVEGAEEQFWEGAKNALDAVNSIIIEMLGPAIKKKLPAKIIESSGFHAYYINDYSLQHSVSGEFTYVYPFYNWLFCRESPTDLRHKLAGTNFKIIE